MKKLILITILIFVMTGAVFASPTSTATGGLFTSEADDFIDPSYYTDVEFEKFYAMTSFASTNQVNLGFAKTIGGLYLGLYYGGTFWSGKTDFPYEERKVWWLGKEKNGVKIYNLDTDPLANSNLNNEASILIGVADMGFQLSFATTYQSFKDTDFINSYGGTDTAVKSAEAATGHLTPQIAWGMAKDLTDNGIRPYLFFQLGFYSDYIKYQIYGGFPDYKPDNEEIAKSENYIAPVIGLGLGGFTFYTKEEFELSADLDYLLTIISRGENEYNYYSDVNDSSKQKVSTFKGFYDYVYDYNINSYVDSFSEGGYSSHEITPSLNGSWSDGNLSFAFSLGLGLKFSSETSTRMSIKNNTYNGTLVKDGPDQSIFEFSFLPSLWLAAQWQVVPKLALNIGGYLSPGTVTRTTTDRSTYTDGKQDEDSSETEVSTTFDGAESLLTLGAKFNATDNLIFEAFTGAGYNDGSGNNNAVSVFSTDRTTNGLLFFFQLLVSVKF